MNFAVEFYLWSTFYECNIEFKEMLRREFNIIRGVFFIARDGDLVLFQNFQFDVKIYCCYHNP